MRSIRVCQRRRVYHDRETLREPDKTGSLSSRSLLSLCCDLRNVADSLCGFVGEEALAGLD